MKLLKNLKNGKESLNGFAYENSEWTVVSEQERKRLQGVVLEIYKDVYQLCKENQIDMFLIGGSAIGAVRHGGFIPWDDDLDVCIQRKDYLKFVKLFHDNLSTKYTLNAPNVTPNAKTRFTKILKKGTILKEIVDVSDRERQGIFLDIFILENVPNNKLVRMAKGYYCNFLEFISGQVYLYENCNERAKQLYCLGGKMNYHTRMFIGKLFSFHSSSKWFDIVDRALQHGNDRSTHCGIPAGRGHYFKEILPRQVFLPAQIVKFEDAEAKIFNDIDADLRHLYGNYMQVPPPEKREKHFIFELNFGE